MHSPNIAARGGGSRRLPRKAPRLPRPRTFTCARKLKYARKLRHEQFSTKVSVRVEIRARIETRTQVEVWTSTEWPIQARVEIHGERCHDHTSAASTTHNDIAISPAGTATPVLCAESLALTGGRAC